jgi:hypothetical protein
MSLLYRTACRIIMWDYLWARPLHFDKLLNNALDFIGYDRIMQISNLGKAGLCFIWPTSTSIPYVTEQFSSKAVIFVLINLSQSIFLLTIIGTVYLLIWIICKLQIGQVYHVCCKLNLLHITKWTDIQN